MLILSRKRQESVVIGATDDMQELVRVTVLEVRSGTVKLGFAANDDVAVHREEVWERVRAENQASSPTPVAGRSQQRVPNLG
jgi:carbon storage regulator